MSTSTRSVTVKTFKYDDEGRLIEEMQEVTMGYNNPSSEIGPMGRLYEQLLNGTAGGGQGSGLGDGFGRGFSMGGLGFSGRPPTGGLGGIVAEQYPAGGRHSVGGFSLGAPSDPSNPTGKQYVFIEIQIQELKKWVSQHELSDEERVKNEVEKIRNQIKVLQDILVEFRKD